MNSTPRLASRFPETPPSRRQNATPRSNNSRLSSSLRDISSLKPDTSTDGPVIPLTTLDGPQQRILALATWGALLAWRIYDWSHLNKEETESLWAFMKWVTIDGVFLFGLPEMRIPWMEWAPITMLFLFAAHALVDFMLMFRIPLPFGAALAAIAKLFFDSELSISERHVKYSKVVQDSSLILGRQTIKILPEGSAVLNPDKRHFCLGDQRKEVSLPVRLNQTIPKSLDLISFDLDSNRNHTTTFTTSQIKKLIKEAQKSSQQTDKDGLLTIRLPVKTTGLYKLGKVLDNSGLEVRRRIVSDTFVVACPHAVIKPLAQNRCRGELSNVIFEVYGSPPLRIKYRKLVNKAEQLADASGIAPENFVSPFNQQDSQSVVLRGKVNATWARPQTIAVPLSETLTTSGRWAVSLTEVQDVFGNKVVYSTRDHDNQEKEKSKAPETQLHQVVTVHERPTALLNGCSPQKPIKIGRNREVDLPVQYSSFGRGGMLETAYHLDYLFTPEAQLSSTSDHSAAPEVYSFSAHAANVRPKVKAPGLYSLHAVSTEFCAGEILEPASCLLQNPPEPSLSISTEEITDKCANKAIGQRVDFHLTGTPPFSIQYIMERREDGKRSVGFAEIDGLRGQKDLTPPSEGHYIYRFTEISDATYKAFSIRDKNLKLEQDVKPSAWASFAKRNPSATICIDQSVSFPIILRGQGPFDIQYELVRGSQRTQREIKNIEGNEYTIVTDALSKGGEYTLSLASVTDAMKCKEYLKEDAKITVQHQKPRASFGLIEGSRTVRSLEHKKLWLPVRLTGNAPWKIEYRNQKSPDKLLHARLHSANDRIEISDDGKYEILSTQDKICPGVVDQSANTIDVEWITRPSFALSEDAYQQIQGRTYTKRDVCEGDEDSIDLHLTGMPPFGVKYEEHIFPESPKKMTGTAKAMKSKALTAALGTTAVRMDTLQPGTIEYRFQELHDYNYDHSSRHFTPLTVKQRVHPRPTARFSNPGKTYSYCNSVSTNVDSIPITLTGQPPFAIDYELKHSGRATPRIHTVSDIKSTTYNLQIPPSDLQAGTSALSLRKVTDSRTCSRILPSTEPRVQISVHAAPSITALDAKHDFCVGDRLSFSLSGVAPFTIHYTFNGAARRATSATTTFRRLAEKPGTFEITAVQDSGSACRATVSDLKRAVHGLPSAKISGGKDAEEDIHEGGTADVNFEFGGEGPWEFTWIRSALSSGRGKRQGEVLEMKSESSEERTFTVKAGEEGVYEVVRVRDRFCEVKREGIEAMGVGGQKLLKN